MRSREPTIDKSDLWIDEENGEHLKLPGIPGCLGIFHDAPGFQYCSTWLNSSAIILSASTDPKNKDVCFLVVSSLLSEVSLGFLPQHVKLNLASRACPLL